MDKTEKIARHLHYIDYFYEQRDIEPDWNELTQSQRNKYLSYARRVSHYLEKERK